MNPLVSGNQQMGNAAPNSPMAQMIQQFQQFRQTFSGDPRQTIQQMLNSGRISQAQYDNAVQTAQQLMNILR